MEPRGLTSSDERRPDGLTMIPWSEGRCLAWDATVSDTLADSHLNWTVHVAGAAAEFAADAKIRKYADLSRAFVFVPVAVETLGPICCVGEEFVTELGRTIANVSGVYGRFLVFSVLFGFWNTDVCIGFGFQKYRDIGYFFRISPSTTHYLGTRIFLSASGSAQRRRVNTEYFILSMALLRKLIFKIILKK